MKHEEVRVAVDALILEKGSKVDRHYLATFSMKDVLDKLGTKNTEANQRYVQYVIKSWYDKPTFYPGQQNSGSMVSLKVRST